MNISSGEILSCIDREELVYLTKKLISIQSHPGVETFEEEAAGFIQSYLQRHGVPARLQQAAPHRWNVTAQVDGRRPQKTLMLTGHIDTVGDYGHKGLFDPVERGGMICGRGACDMKGAVAAMMEAALALVRSGARPGCTLRLAFVADEEFKSLGTECLIESGVSADAAILGEPTGFDLCLGNRGLEWVDVLVEGKGTHGATASRGVSAILGAVRLVESIQSDLLPKFREREHPVIGCPTLNVGVIRGGNQPSTVPEKCLLKIDRRWVFGESVEGIYAEFQQLIDRLHREDEGFRATLSRDMTNMNKMEHGPVCLDAGHPLVGALSGAAGEVLGERPRLSVFPGWSDASLLANFGHIPTAIFGPGDISCAHSEREAVGVEDLFRAAAVYAKTALSYGAQ